MWLRPSKLRLAVIAGAILAVCFFLLEAADKIGNIETLANIIRGFPKLAQVGWFRLLVYACGVLIILGVIYVEGWRRREAAVSAAKYTRSDELPVLRSSGGGYEQGASEDRAVVMWFENKSKFDYANVRAWLRFATRSSLEGEYEEYDGLWLDEALRSVTFKAGDKKALVVAIREKTGEYFAVTNPRESQDVGGIPKPITLNDKVYFIRIVLNVDGTSTKPLRMQLELQPKLELRHFGHG